VICDMELYRGSPVRMRIGVFMLYRGGTRCITKALNVPVSETGRRSGMVWLSPYQPIVDYNSRT
jgi:hypothetical protein